MSDQPIEWTGDLDDDCSARWCGLLLRAAEMNGGDWWWAVSDLNTGQELESSNDKMTRIATGSAARARAEAAARRALLGRS